MTDRTTINVTKEAHQAAKAAKEDDENWSEYLRRCIDNPPTNPAVDGEAIAEELKNEISMANDPAVEVDTDRIINRIDDLESRLPRKVKEELR